MDLSVWNNSPPSTHSHHAYGLNLLSSASIPGLADEHADISNPDIVLELGPEPSWVTRAIQLPSIKQGSKPATLEAEDSASTFSVLGDEEFFELAYSDGTRFVVDRAAQHIWGTCPPPLTIEDLATYLLGPVMGFALRRRGTLSLHASAICIDGQAVVLCGETASGKSTTASALALQGIPVLCEDVAALAETGDGFLVEAGYPRICLWPNSVRDLYGATDALPLLTPTWEKRYLPLDGESAKFERHRRPLSAIYLLAPRVTENDAPRIEDLSTRESLLELIRNTYMNRVLDRTQRQTEFDVLGRLVMQVSVRRIVPHTDIDRIGALCDLITSDAGRLIAHRNSPGFATLR